MDATPRTPPTALTRGDLMDLIRAGVILAVTVFAAMVVPPKVFGAVRDATAIQADGK